MHERLPRAPGRPTSQDRLMASIDPVTVSVVQHRLHAIVEEMGEAMLRTSYSQILNSSRDFSTALSDPEGRLIAQAEHVPIHVGALPWAVKSVHDFFRGRIHAGDVFLLNDPYRGGNHLPDLTAFVPVFDGDRLAFWSINRSHQSDIGGATHGATIRARPKSGRRASACRPSGTHLTRSLGAQPSVRIAGLSS